MSSDRINKRVLRLKQKFRKQIASEYETQFQNIRDKDDYLPQLEHFLEVLTYTIHPEEMQKRINSKLITALCIQRRWNYFSLQACGCSNWHAGPLRPRIWPLSSCRL